MIPMNFRQKIILFLATGGYLGHLPIAPGTFGSLPGLLICLAMSEVPLGYAIFLVLVLIGVAIGIAQQAEKMIGDKDSNSIVIDEMAGMTVTLLGIPVTPFSLILGFFFFRGFDILKPFPARLLDQKVPGGAGIVLDDVMAGLYGNVLIRIVLWIMATVS
jgi:phosphatidylglycerophosphatase A